MLLLFLFSCGCECLVIESLANSRTVIPKIIEYGFDIGNDVSGFGNKENTDYTDNG